MASEEEDSWISILKANGIEAEAVISGFGEIKVIQNIFLSKLSLPVTLKEHSK